MSHRSSHIAISILAILAVSQPLSAAIYHSLALTGELAPGLSGTPYLRFDDNTRVAINSSGVVAFTGEARGLGIWVGKPGDLSIAFVHGTTPPIPGLVFGDVRSAAGINLTDSGYLGFLEGPPMPYTPDRLWRWKDGTMEFIVQSQDPVPGLPGVTFANVGLGPHAMNNAGQTLLPFVLSDQSRGLLLAEPGKLTLIARSGTPAPGADGKTFFDAGFLNQALNDNGEVGLHGIISVETSPQDRGIWVGKPDDLKMLVRAGYPSPVAGGAVFNDVAIAEPVLNNTGKLAFGIRGNLWYGTPDAVKLIASHQYIIGINLADSGKMAFWTPSGLGYILFAGDEKGFKAIAREGMAAPGTAPGVTYTIFPNDTPRLNESGQVAFRFWLTGPGVTAANDEGIWATDATGAVSLIAREGMIFNFGDGDLRQISYLGKRFELNDQGTVIFVAGFTDGSSGVFTASLPEPGTTVLAISAATLLLRRRPRHDTVRPAPHERPSQRFIIP